jgi:hypothetical protein
MAKIPARIAMLRTLRAVNGVELCDSDEGLQELNDWYVTGVEPDPDRPGWLAQQWYSVSSDVALYLGDVLIGRCPGLHWEFHTSGKKSLSYQQAVITGFAIWPVGAARK